MTPVQQAYAQVSSATDSRTDAGTTASKHAVADVDLHPFNDVALEPSWCNCNKACGMMTFSWVKGYMLPAAAFFLYLLQTDDEQDPSLRVRLERLFYSFTIIVSVYAIIFIGSLTVHTSKCRCVFDVWCNIWFAFFNLNQSFCSALICCRFTGVHYIRFLHYNRVSLAIKVVTTLLQGVFNLLYMGNLTYISLGLLGLNLLWAYYDYYKAPEKTREAAKEFHVSLESDPTIPEV